MRVTRSDTKGMSAAKCGILAGLTGGLVLFVLMALLSTVQGRDVWQVLKMAGMPFLGSAAAQPGFALGPVLIGIQGHFAVSLIWGLLFGLLFDGLGPSATFALGILWGLVVWFCMFYVVLPVIGLASLASSISVALAVFEHVIFGLTVAVSFLSFQCVGQRPSEPPIATRRRAAQ